MSGGSRPTYPIAVRLSWIVPHYRLKRDDRIQAMDTLLARYEQGAATRRELLGGLAVLAAPLTRQVDDGVLQGSTVSDRVQISTPDWTE